MALKTWTYQALENLGHC